MISTSPAAYHRTGDAGILKICVLASSSSGNCAFIGTDRARILVDCGLSRKETIARMAAIGEDLANLDAVVVTHEHSDHVLGLVSIARSLKKPVYLTERTAASLDWGSCHPVIQHFQAGTSFRVGDIDVDSFTIPHDAADPVGFSFRSAGVKASIVTDLGYIPASIGFHLRSADWVLMESNHDLGMLRVGPYPWSVKQRIMGRNGHLSNDHAARFIAEDLDSHVSTLILGHLSENTNHPALADQAARMALEDRGLNTRLIVAEPKKALDAFVY